MPVSRLSFALLPFIVLGIVGNSEAQQCRRGGGCGNGGGGGNVIDMRASTPWQGIMMGEADVIRAQGMFNKLTAEAASIAQDAYSKALDNDVKRVEYFYKKKEIHDYNVQRTRKPRLTKEVLARMHEERAPKRSAKRHIDTAGEISWPKTLEGSEYTAARTELDALFAERANGNSGLGTENFRQIQQAAQQLKSALQDQVSQLDSMEYMQASKFIDGLKYEARFESQAVKGLAAN